jgi:hypothetical protein
MIHFGSVKKNKSDLEKTRYLLFFGEKTWTSNLIFII